jgi:hypothetical protein
MATHANALAAKACELFTTLLVEAMRGLDKSTVLRSRFWFSRDDDTLMLAFRDDSINVYYRGGSILQLKQETGGYAANFDRDYAKNGHELFGSLPPVIKEERDCKIWLDAMPALKEIMNSYLAKKRKSEREFQQLVAWENNRSGISSITEYFITDIEFHASLGDKAMRADMLSLKWPAGLRSGQGVCTPAIVEMKYGIESFVASSSAKKGSGIKEHFDDICDFFGVGETDDTKKKMAEARKVQLYETIRDQFHKLWKLDLVRFNESKAFLKSDKPPMVSGIPEFIFLLANNNPRSTALASAINSIPEEKIMKAEEHFKLRFFAASFAGYGMHDACMMELADIKKHLNAVFLG